MFPTELYAINRKIHEIDPIEYSRTRNFLNGSVTQLSPYISRGFINTKQVLNSLCQRGYQLESLIPFIKELAWREYFQRTWCFLEDKLCDDIKKPQAQCEHHLISKNLINACTGITAVDEAIQQLYETGYMHNHMRMYVASIACNIGRAHWMLPAKWMYYHLLDADWASNVCSWQWVAGCFSNKKYYANQNNINHYCYTRQQHTFLDVEYEQLVRMEIPDILAENTHIEFNNLSLHSNELRLNIQLPTYVYNFYNLDHAWDPHIKANRVLLWEPSFLKRFPISMKVLNFAMNLAANIPNIQFFVGEFDSLYKIAGSSVIHYKEHPTNRHYKGTEHQRVWLFPNVEGYHHSFSAYWKQCEKHLRKFNEKNICSS
ncbi:MAG: deoxyribodipyrimidine photolyase [Sphingobacteriia bacterium]|nr:deoxyribodipyrimidine photolyase [Sphingobacteriia bacterium]